MQPLDRLNSLPVERQSPAVRAANPFCTKLGGAIGWDRANLYGLLALAVILCVANIWYAAARSTIPLAMNGQVTRLHIGTEKHPGVDDAYVITLDSKREVRIDGSLFEQLAEGDQLAKHAWQRELQKNGQAISLGWSRDTYGLVGCMSAALVVIAFMVLSAAKI